MNWFRKAGMYNIAFIPWIMAAPVMMHIAVRLILQQVVVREGLGT